MTTTQQNVRHRPDQRAAGGLFLPVGSAARTKLKVLNLYAGIGGNRALWSGVDVTAVESDRKIADVYAGLHPADNVIVGDAHQYLLDHFEMFDFIWSSPPCQSHSRMVKATRHKVRRYTDLSLYEEIMLLQKDFAGAWVVENVVPYYAPLIQPTFKVGRHLFWASDFLMVQDVERPANFINMSNMAGRAALQEWLGIHFDEVLYYAGNHCPAQVLRNAVHPLIGQQVFDGLISSPAAPTPEPRSTCERKRPSGVSVLASGGNSPAASVAGGLWGQE